MVDTKKIMQAIPIQTIIENYTKDTFRHNAIRCPFHNDEHPSLTVKGNRFRCWSCGASGSGIDFVQRLYGDSFLEAVRRIADDFNLDIPTDQNIQRTTRPDLWDDAKLEVEAMRVAELTNHIDKLIEEANCLTDEHLRLWQAGEHEAAEDVAERIDRIEEEKEWYINYLKGVNYGNRIL